MRTAGILLALVAALAIQTSLAGMTVGGTTAVNLVLVTVVFVALSFGAVTGVLAGTVGGLLQDALAGGIIGIGGLAKSLVGFVVGVLGAQFIVSQTVPRFVMFVGATILHEACFQALHALVEARPFRMSYSTVLMQAAINACLGILAFWVVESGPKMLERRRASRTSLSRRRF
jgi:rod shape-determining protein MreD